MAKFLSLTITQDSDTRKTWDAVDKITARLEKFNKQLTKIIPGAYASVVLTNGKQLWVGADWEYKSSYDMDDSIGMRCFSYLRTDVHYYGNKPWRFVGFVLFGKGMKFWCEKKADLQYAQRACNAVYKIYKEAVKHTEDRRVEALRDMQENYAKYRTLTGDARYWAGRTYASAVKRNPEVAAKNGFPKFAYMKMLVGNHG
jgi:hypothetical protein